MWWSDLYFFVTYQNFIYKAVGLAWMFSGCVQMVTCYFMIALHTHKSVVLRAVNTLLINKIVNLFVCVIGFLKLINAVISQK